MSGHHEQRRLIAIPAGATAPASLEGSTAMAAPDISSRDYPGDAAWANHAAMFRPAAAADADAACDEMRALIPQDGELAVTIAGVPGQAAAWFGRRIGALDGLLPPRSSPPVSTAAGSSGTF